MAKAKAVVGGLSLAARRRLQTLKGGGQITDKEYQAAVRAERAKAKKSKPKRKAKRGR